MILKATCESSVKSKIAMAILNGSPTQFGSMITPLNALGNDNEGFYLDKVKNLHLQKEQVCDMRVKERS